MHGSCLDDLCSAPHGVNLRVPLGEAFYHTIDLISLTPAEVTFLIGGPKA